MPATEIRSTFDLERIALFEGLEPALLEKIGHSACCKSAVKGERIYWQGETPRAFYYVLSGHVRRALASPVGEEKVIDIFSPGQSFGLAELFGTAPYVSFAEAVETTVFLQVDKEVLLAALAESRVLTLRVLAAAADRQASLERDVAACFFQSGSARLIDYLLRAAGPALRSCGDTTLELPVSKSLIAARIGVTAETLSRSLRELSDAGLITVRGRTVVLHAELVARHGAAAEERAPAAARQRWTREPQPAAWVGGQRLARQAASRTWM